MTNLTYESKIAVLKILTEIMNADNIVHENEAKYMNQVLTSLGMDDSVKPEIGQILTLKAISLIRQLPTEAKCEIAQMMGKMIIIDNDINYNEVILYNAFCQSCDIDGDFNIDDYPDYLLSGPFFNPEEL
jgi:uncharacterized tellurite resistance protein B-like protein